MRAAKRVTRDLVFCAAGIWDIFNFCDYMLVNRYLSRNRGMLGRAFEEAIQRKDTYKSTRSLRKSTQIKSQESEKKATSRSMKPELRYLIEVLDRHKLSKEF